MQIAVVVELDRGEYRSRCRHPVAAEAAGHSRYEATRALETALAGRVPDPFELLVLEATPDKPWVASAGAIPDDETTDLWLDGIAEYRRQCDAADRIGVAPTPNAQPAP